MAVVKGSKQEKMVVVKYRPWKTFIIRTVVLVTLTIATIGGYFLGQYQGINENGNALAQRDVLLVEVANFENQVNVLQQELTNSEQASLVDKQALEEVQKTIITFQENTVQLEEDILFYKKIMSPENEETGLIIGQLDLISTGEVNRIRYRLELRQAGNNEGMITGYANVNILGMQDAQELSMPLRSVSDDEDQLDIKLRFRYFQNIVGEIILPDNFNPDKIQIIAVSEGSDPKTVQKSFAWVVES
jgi:hypothetical protein